jgi:hypothetical protein
MCSCGVDIAATLSRVVPRYEAELNVGVTTDSRGMKGGHDTLPRRVSRCA